MSAADRLTRLFALVPYLQNNQGIPVRDVAAQFGVSVRDIMRDISTLWVTGVGDLPGELIDFDYDALEDEGLIYIRDAEFLPRPLRLSRNEGIALMIGLRTLRETADASEYPVIDSALAKLDAAVGDANQAAVDVHVEKLPTELVTTIRQALTDGLRLELDYASQSRDERAIRQVDPLRLFTSEGFHYLEAWCLREQDVRIFRLDRMFVASLTGEAAEKREAEPRDLTPGVYDTPGAPFGIFELDPAAHWMIEYYHATDVVPSGETVRAKIVGADRAWLVRFALRHAGSVRVLEPAALAEEVSAAAGAALSAYDGTNGTSKE